MDKARNPEQGRLVVENDDATNYLSGLLARTAFTEIRTAAASGTAKRYFDQMLIGFTDLKARRSGRPTAPAPVADGTTPGPRRRRPGRCRYGQGGGRARRTGEQIGQANRGAADLANGLATLDAGTGQLADASAQVAAGTQLLAAKVSASTRGQPSRSPRATGR
jgi:putative membrane protein